MENIQEDIFINHILPSLNQRDIVNLCQQFSHIKDMVDKRYNIIFPEMSYKECCKRDAIVSLKKVVDTKYPWYGAKYASRNKRKELLYELLEEVKSKYGSDEYDLFAKNAIAGSYASGDDNWIHEVEKLFYPCEGEMIKICYNISQFGDIEYIKKWLPILEEKISQNKTYITCEHEGCTCEDTFGQYMKKGELLEYIDRGYRKVKGYGDKMPFDNADMGINMYKYILHTLKQELRNGTNLDRKYEELYNHVAQHPDDISLQLLNIALVRLSLDKVTKYFTQTNDYIINLGIAKSLSRQTDMRVVDYLSSKIDNNFEYLLRMGVECGNIILVKHYKDNIGVIMRDNWDNCYINGHKDMIEYLKIIGVKEPGIGMKLEITAILT
ncbi:Hypothetical protein ORPV_833 [Orpheovirus IHUMI-LCC2]|uniref:Uncharacterized protein n=1 Tax=Orpheovirus IHUMI-LCC2 TaxID=2023057 RepID=A0A2I2L5D7_9VIRU|nr:Hypothetical protein ORPV_833 [Orpheovirus IHUMI-LCC2]SNW62737.1 Hypothetical protein ORPV_833 [Orpheovirus IHUMI-LCC2]